MNDSMIRNRTTSRPRGAVRRGEAILKIAVICDVLGQANNGTTIAALNLIRTLREKLRDQVYKFMVDVSESRENISYIRYEPKTEE